MDEKENYRLDILAALVKTINDRSNASAQKSYTARLISKGSAKCAEKFGEEAIETVIAGVSQDDDALIAEAADTLFHLLVLLKSRNVELTQIMIELESRMKQSGLQEKASRPDA